ncbi:MAG: hypothetical protein ACI38Q_07820 [Candidatus Bruticola sp.]
MKLGKIFQSKISVGAACLALVGGLWLTGDGLNECWAASSPWQQLYAPNTGGGLVIDPQLLAYKRLQVFFGWSNNNSAVKAPEFSFSVFESGDKWTTINAPFFGSNLAGVRKVAAASAKYSVGILFMHNIVEQSENAFEVMYSYSGDNGWSFSKPAVCDSFVLSGGGGGSDIDIAGVGGRKPSLCFGWTAENNMVKAALFDPQYRGDRPRACNLGHQGINCDKIELAGESKGGFVAVWNDGQNLLSSYIRPLVGSNEDSIKAAKGKFGLNFSLCDNFGKDPLLVYDLPRLGKNDKCRRQVRRWDNGAWQVVAAAPPAAGEAPIGSTLESCQDKDGNLYVASLSRDGESILYSRLKDGKFSDPEVAVKLKPIIGCTGFSIAVLDKYVYIFASQGPSNQFVRRAL